MSTATQRHRQLSISTPLGDDTFLLTGFTGSEQLSRPFQFDVELLSADTEILPVAIVGKNVTFQVRRESGQPRYFNGFVRTFCAGAMSRAARFRRYRTQVVPWLWFLTRTADCRIFQHQRVPDIIAQIFRDLGFSDFDDSRLTRSYQKRTYCVQYRETDFDFVSRLMEEEGIFYTFRHENGKHTLVMADAVSAYRSCPDGTLRYERAEAIRAREEWITRWEHRYEYQSGRWATTDYNFEKPGMRLMSTERSVLKLAGSDRFEVYDYPGRYDGTDRGRQLARVRMEQEEAAHDVVAGESLCRAITPGQKFTLQDFEVSAENGCGYLFTSVEHEACEPSEYETAALAARGGSEPERFYRNRFTCIPDSVIFRPARITRKPVVEGPQTAVVVGPPGEEIYPDKHGRVKVQFHWDRESKRDENSSCWIRVSQVHAGQGWGGIDLPRIGEEVIVDFLEGDPDQPIITGRVYNGDNPPPFNLPDEKTRSGMKSQTHKGAGFNEISMDDTAGAEQIRIHGQYDMDTSVNNNQTLKVGVDRTTEIGNNDAATVGNDSAESVGNDKSVDVGNNMQVGVGNRLVVNAGASITLKCGASKIHMNAGGVISITGTIITMAAAANAAVAAPLTQVIGGAMLTAIGGINTLQGGVTQVGGAALCSVSGGKVDVVGGETSIQGSPIKLN